MDSESEESSSFLSQLQSKLKKGGLKATTTKTTYPDGSVQYTSGQGSSQAPGSGPVEKSFGFVVDEKPDLTIGQVLPWLFVSSQDVPGDEKILRRIGITHVLSLLPGYQLPPETKALIEHHLVLEVFDEEGFSLSGSECEMAFLFINGGRESNGKVLVHCNAGISRAPSLTIAYLIKEEKLALEEAWELVKSGRPGMRPNAGFKKQLEEMAKK